MSKTNEEMTAWFIVLANAKNLIAKDYCGTNKESLVKNSS